MKIFKALVLVVLILNCLNANAFIGGLFKKGGIMLETKKTAPAFTLLDQDEQSRSLEQYKGSYVLIYFYPKDDTPGCTKEACAIRDNFGAFDELSVSVLGISPDSPKSHKKFADKYHLPFTLLSDTKKEVAKLYGADGIFLKRISYLIGPEGDILKTYPNVDPANHASEIIEDIKSIKS